MEDAELRRILNENIRRISKDSLKRAERIVKLTELNFQEHVRSSKPVLVDFWAEWCGPCKMMEPIIERLADKYSDKVTFGKVNVDEEINLSSRYQVFSIPTFMIFKDGKPVDAIIGAVSEVALEQFLKRAL